MKKKGKKKGKLSLFRFILKYALLLSFVCLVIGAVLGFIYTYSIYREAKSDFKKLVNVNILPVPTRVYASDGTLIAKFGLQNRIPVKLSQVSPYMRKAILAAEDARFYEHGAISIRSIVRALIVDITHGRIIEGGSTITQQLVKNLYLTPSKTLKRKIKEAILAYKLEKELTKNQILQLYLNTVYFGNGAWGIQSAAETYFDKPASKLTLPESALLAGLVQAPSTYDPYKHPRAAAERMVYVLNQMLYNHFITRAEYNEAIHSKVYLKKPASNVFGILMAPYFTQYVRTWLINRYGEDVVYKAGFKVYTTLNTRLQRYAFVALKKHVLRLCHGKYDGLQAALIAMNPKNGYVVAMIGGFDYSKSQFNRAVYARRQPGSSFKPIVYLTALQQGYRPTDTIDDAPVVFRFGDKIWRPLNYSRKFHGVITLMYALVHSINVATVKLAYLIGVNNIVNTAIKLGIGGNIPHNLSIALGSYGVTPLEMVRVYASFDNYGLLPKPIFVTRVENRYGQVIYKAVPQLKRVFSPLNGFIITGMLRNVIGYGTGRAARVIHRPLAGKTGTTNNYTNAWFDGYSPHLVCVVWVGYDNNKPMPHGYTGAYAALPIWIDFMENALKDRPIDIFPVPKGVTKQVLDMLKPPPPPLPIQPKYTLQDRYYNTLVD